MGRTFHVRMNGHIARPVRPRHAPSHFLAVRAALLANSAMVSLSQPSPSVSHAESGISCAISEDTRSVAAPGSLRWRADVMPRMHARAAHLAVLLEGFQGA